MERLLMKYMKYIVLLALIFRIIYTGIPDDIESIFIYEYSVFFGLLYLLFILADFFNPSKKTDILLRIVIIISAIALLTTSIYYKATFSIIFSSTMLIACIVSLFLEIKLNKKNKQKD